MTYTATYSPEDNKLRLSASARLSKELYDRVKTAGFAWAPRQGIFVAPKWTPDREDLCLELAVEIGDEDTSLVERAEERAERFDGYSDNRTADAERAKDAVRQIADGIPFGQPILIGHHSQRHAERDADKIKRGMQCAVKMWETAKYWEYRAAGAIAHAKYKELPAVRARRIKTIEADMRSMVADYTPHANTAPILQTPRNWEPSSRDLTPEQGEAERDAARVPHVLVGPAGRGSYWVAQSALERIAARRGRAIEHCRMRLIYERAMLAESGGLEADKFDIAVGGRVQYGGVWYVVARLNRKAGVLQSVSLISSSWPSKLNVEDIKGYEPPSEGIAEKVSKITKLAPLCNYRAVNCVEMTSEQWKRAQRASDSYHVATFTLDGQYAGWGKRGDYRQRSAYKPGDFRNRLPVFLTDSKVIEPPTVKPEPVAPVISGLMPERTEARPMSYKQPERTEFDDMKDALRTGVAVRVVSAPQLFQTPKALAQKMIEMAGGICAVVGRSVLEPSAGTGRIVEQVAGIATGFDCVRITAVEINQSLVTGLHEMQRRWIYANDDNFRIIAGDFLEQGDNLGKFDVVLMNPPFAEGADIKHIRHAVKLLKPDGVLVAICANGPRQRAALMDEAEHWEDLPAGTFAESGTQVNTALLVMRANAIGVA